MRDLLRSMKLYLARHIAIFNYLNRPSFRGYFKSLDFNRKYQFFRPTLKSRNSREESFIFFRLASELLPPVNLELRRISQKSEFKPTRFLTKFGPNSSMICHNFQIIAIYIVCFGPFFGPKYYRRSNIPGVHLRSL